MSPRLRVLIFTFCCICFVPSCTNTTTINAVELANESLESEGSPYRWHIKSASGDGVAMQKKLIGTVAATAADSDLKKDILVEIEKSELASGGQSRPNLIETRSVLSGKNGISEIWVIGREGDKKSAYSVEMKPAVEGETDLYITGPW